MKVPAMLMVLLALFTLAEAAYLYPQLPDTVANHFGANGEADGWSSKRSNLIFMLVLNAFLVGSFLSAHFLMRRLPNSLINVPNKDYWLAPERREATLDDMSTGMLWIGAMTMALIALLNDQVLRANLTPEPRLGAVFWVGMTAYLVAVLVAVIRHFKRFAIPAEPA